MAGFDNPMFTSPESMQPMMWDSALDQQLIASYNQIMNQASDFYSSFDSPAAGSPVSDDSSTRSHSRRTSKIMAEVKGAISDKVERRREQNRQSQRAYRDRKEKHQRDLEAQIAAWKEKHEKLVASYTAQAEEVSQLKAQVNELNSKIMALQSGMTPELWTSTCQTPQDFDIVPFIDRKSSPWDRDDSI